MAHLPTAAPIPQTARVLDGRARAAEIRTAVARRSREFQRIAGRPPCLVTLSVGDDPAETAYARAKARAAVEAGVTYRDLHLTADAGEAAVVRAIQALNGDATVDGVLLAMPLPPGYDRRRVTAELDPARDVDAVTPDSQGRQLSGRAGPRPATALAALDLIHLAGINLEGVRATVVGRSTVVGLPVALLLLAGHATVTIAHSRTPDLAAVTCEAEVLVCAAGVPALIGPRHIRPGATVIDVGITTVGEEGRIVGDVDFAAAVAVAAAISPVPGGVGPVTTAIILRTTLDLAEQRAG